MATVNISLSLSTAATAVSVVSLVSGVTGLPVVGVTLPIALTNSVGNTWIGSFNDPNPSSFYVAAGMLTLPGGIISGPFSFNVSGVVAPATGYYINYVFLCTKYGTINITKWSNHDNNDLNPDMANVQTGINVAESEFNNLFANGPYTVPLTPINFQIQDWVSAMAAYWTYQTRGFFESDDPTGNKLRAEYNRAKNWATAYKGNTSTLSLPCNRRWPTPTSAVAVRGFR